MSSVKGQEITFRINKYKQTALLNDRDSLVQLILNALLMVPGNMPSQPKKGVDIFQYLYKKIDSDSMSDRVLVDLKYTVGEDVGSSISNLTVDLIEMGGDGPVFLIIIHLLTTSGDDEALALAVQKVNETVKFNYRFLTDAVKNMT